MFVCLLMNVYVTSMCKFLSCSLLRFVAVLSLCVCVCVCVCVCAPFPCLLVIRLGCMVLTSVSLSVLYKEKSPTP